MKLAAALFILFVLLMGATGYIYNIIYTFHQTALVPVVLGVAGVVVPPVGSIIGLIHLIF